MSPRGAVRGRHWLVRSALAVPAALVVGVALAGTALAGTSSSTPAAPLSIAGSWLETITSPDGSFPSFQVLITFDSGGVVVATASIDSTSGLKSSPTHGAWSHLSGSQFAVTGHAFSFADDGTPNGYYNIHEVDTVTDKNAYSGTGTFEVVNGPGAIPSTPYHLSAVRINP